MAAISLPFFHESLLLCEDSDLSGPAFQTLMCMQTTWGFGYNVSFNSVNLGWGLRFFIFKSLPADANAVDASPWVIFGVAKFY